MYVRAEYAMLMMVAGSLLLLAPWPVRLVGSSAFMASSVWLGIAYVWTR